jgi:hypothetical protein
MGKRVKSVTSGVSLAVVLLSYLVCVTMAVSVFSVVATGGWVR